MEKICIYNFNLKNTQTATLDLFIDGTIVDANTEQALKEFYNDNTSLSYKTIRDQILTAKPQVLNLHINSPGGSVVEAIAIHDFIQELQKQGVEVNGYGIGLVASASTYILSGCQNSFLTPNSLYMIHNISGGISGTIKDVENYYGAMVVYDGLVKNFYSKLTNKSVEQITEWMDAETYFTAEDAVANGFVMAICKEMPLKNIWDAKNFNVKNTQPFDLHNQFVNNNNNNNNDMNNFKEVLENAFKEFGFKKEPDNKSEELFKATINEALANVVFTPNDEQLQNAISKHLEVSNADTNERIKELETELEAVKTAIANSLGGAKPQANNVQDKYEGITFNN